MFFTTWPRSNMNEYKVKHLEFIQSIVLRMAGNSFLIKGWSVTLVAAAFALAAAESSQQFILIAFVPVGMFWGLDAYFLGQEREFRALYDEVRIKEESGIDFAMKRSGSESIDSGFWKCFFSGTTAFFHGPILGITLFVMFAF